MKISVDRKVLLLVSAALIAMTLFGGFAGRTSAVEGTYDYLKVFNEVLYLATNNYVEPVQVDQLMEGAYRGLLESLDPGNEYLRPDEYKKATQADKSGLADVGLVLSKRHGYVVVVSTIPGTPAAGGMVTGDAILTIDGRTTRTMGAWEAAQALRGKAGTKVTLGVNPVTGGDRKNVTLERKPIVLPQPSGDLSGTEIGVVRLATIGEGDARRLSQTIATLQTRGMKRLLLDLRGCASDSVAEPIGMASLFINDGVVVKVEDRYEGDKTYRTDGRKRAWNGPLAVLVDRGTSHGCELLTAALRDGLGAAIVGERTWGSGTLSSVLPLRNGDGVILATGLMQSPAGKEWNGKGLEPDLAIEGDASQAGDPQRQKAIDYLKGLGTPGARDAA
ncbi:MAG TPA: S41 family peptidase [Patescibacteria group bacterium]|nr:S41 family peptidase [Patescibacteria group bacterium]